MTHVAIYCFYGRYYGGFLDNENITAEGDSPQEVINELLRLKEVWQQCEIEDKLERELDELGIDLSDETK